MDIKPIETEYKGYKFRSRLEARWAVFFDACGVKWEYEPEGFDLGNGLYYLPDFLLHDVICRLNQGNQTMRNLWVEVKGVMTEVDAKKIVKFTNQTESTMVGLGLYTNPILIVTNIPSGDDITNIADYITNEWIFGKAPCPFNFNLIDGDCYGAYPVIVGESIFQKLALVGGDHLWGFNEQATVNAYKKARQARFERRRPNEIFD